MPADDALRPLPRGALLSIGNGALQVDVAPHAGGRIAQIKFDGAEWLAAHRDDNAAAIAWGSYPLLPWAGRVRHGRFAFDGVEHRLPINLGAHAIHGVGFVLPWQVDVHTPSLLELSLQLPRDERWPFGGSARQRIEVRDDALQLDLAVTAADVAMPLPVLGWHPWFLKPERIEFAPQAMYPRDAEGIATLPPGPPSAGPWDDCFVNHKAVVLHRGEQRLRLLSDCKDWVVYDEPAVTTCVEPQSGPPDAFNLLPQARLEPRQTRAAWFTLEWSPAPAPHARRR